MFKQFHQIADCFNPVSLVRKPARELLNIYRYLCILQDKKEGNMILHSRPTFLPEFYVPLCELLEPTLEQHWPTMCLQVVDFTYELCSAMIFVALLWPLELAAARITICFSDEDLTVVLHSSAYAGACYVIHKRGKSLSPSGFPTTLFCTFLVSRTCYMFSPSTLDFVGLILREAYKL
jgi:hypothetical protein